MVSSPPSTAAPWSKAVLRSASEFGLSPLPVISGALPPGLSGSLYRNGPARLERGGQRMGHWFDGDGAILAVHFAAGSATGIYRYVQTSGYQAEADANRLLFGNYGMTPPGPIWTRFGKLPKNTANTSVLALGDRLLALWEAGHPHALNLQTLETLGMDSLTLPENLPYSAHPKRDPATGEIFNFGVLFGRQAILNLYKSGADGQVRQRAEIPLDGIPLIHDFVLAGRYLVFFIAPLRINPLLLLLNLQTLSDALTWKPDEGTQWLVVDRETLEVVCRGEAEPWFQWHFGNGYVDESGNVVASIVRYPDFLNNRYLQEVSTGEIHTAVRGTFWQVRIDPIAGKLVENRQMLDRGCEFPTVAPQEVGQPERHTYLSVHRAEIDGKGDLFGAIARFDHPTETLTVADLGEHRYPTEPIYAPDPQHPDRGWVLTVVYDGDRDCSEVWIFESDRLDSEPICQLALPGVVPPGFHGTWKPGS